MKIEEKSNKILIIVGMHRSMTSLATHWLYKCGLHVGHHIHGADTGNVKGHYEDMDFMQLHQYILKDNERGWRIVTDKDYELDEYARLKSSGLIKLKNSLNQQWGWKDPRTCLFLDHWAMSLPEAKFLIVYRPYTEVVDSLFRRRFSQGESMELMKNFRNTIVKLLRGKEIKTESLKLWCFYNNKILKFLEATDENRYLVIKNDRLINGSHEIYHHLTDRWNFDLEYVSMDSIFNANLTIKAERDTLDGIDEGLLKEANKIQNHLTAFAEVSQYPEF